MLDEATAFDPDPGEGLGYLLLTRKVNECGHHILIALIIPFEMPFLTFSPHRLVLPLLCACPLYELGCLSLCLDGELLRAGRRVPSPHEPSSTWA